MFDIQKIIDEAVIKASTRKTMQREISRFNTSDAGTCYRKRFYKRLGIEPTKQNTIQGFRKMMSGTASHEKVQYLLKRTGKIIMAEDEIGDEHRVGHSDGIIKENNELAVIDFKTIEKWSMTNLSHKGASKNHEIQLFTYWVDLRKLIPNLNHAMLFYMKREDWEGKPFNYIWSKEIQNKVDNDWNPLIEYWVKGELPPCTCDKDYDGNGIKYCSYSTSETECCDEKLYEAIKLEASNRIQLEQQLKVIGKTFMN